MQKLWRLAALAVIFSLVSTGADWPSQSGGPQRDAWARSEKILTKDNVGSLELLYAHQTDNVARGMNSLSTPIISGLLITYRGFKEMLVFSGSSDNVYSVDADLNRLLWKRHFEGRSTPPPSASAVCPGGLTTAVAMPGSSSAGFKAPPKPAAKQPETKASPEKPKPPKEQAADKAAAAKLEMGFGRLGGMFTVSSDGMLHALNSSTGEDLLPPVKFVPPHSNVSSLNVMNNVIYAATTNHCGGKANALYAVDLATEAKTVTTFEVKGGEISGIGGTALGSDGTIYINISGGKNGKSGPYADSLVALTPELTVKDYFKPVEAAAGASSDSGITPVVFTWKEKEMVLTGATDGRLYLLDAASPGGSDHKTPLFQTDAVGGFRGAFASWYDADSQTRWFYAPVGGSVASSSFGMKNGDVSSGALVAFQLSDVQGHPVLKPVWVSRDIPTPAPPVVANEVVYALSNGDAKTPAVLHALDAFTGKELYSSGNMAKSFSHAGGVAIANGRVYFTTHDNLLYCLGFSKLNPQLTDR